MASNDKRAEAPSDKPAEPPRRRRRWFVALAIVLAIAGSVWYWRLPLAGAALRTGLDLAGIDGAELSVTALSASRLGLGGVRLGPALQVRKADVALDLLRLPENPVTALALDGVRLDLTQPAGPLRQWLGRRRPAAKPTTLRTMLDGVEALPDIAVTDLSLRTVAGGSVIAVDGAAEVRRDGSGAVDVHVSMEVSGTLGGTAHAVAFDGTAHVGKDAAAARVTANTPDGAATGTFDARAELSADAALVDLDGSVHVGDIGALAGLVPALGRAGGKVDLSVRTMSPLPVALDTPLGAPSPETALQRAGDGGIRLDAAIEDGTHGAEIQGVRGTLSAELHGASKAPGRLGADGTLSLRAQRLEATGVSLDDVALAGPFRLVREGESLTVVFPKELHLTAATLSDAKAALSIAPVALALTGGRGHALHVDFGGARKADMRLRLDAGATRVRTTGEPARQVDLAPFILRMVGLVDADGMVTAHFRIPKLDAAMGDRSGKIDDLALTLRRSGISTTGQVRGRISAQQGGKPLVNPIPLRADLSLWRDILTFDGKAELPGASAVTAKGRYDLFAGKGSAALALPAFRVTPGGGEFRALAPSLSGFDVRSGTVHASADLAWSGDALDGKAAVRIDDATVVLGAGDTTVAGLNADIRLDRLVPPRTPAGQQVRVKHIAAAIPFDDLAFRFALTDGVAPDVPALRIEAFDTAFAGGTLSVAPTVLDSAADSSRATVAVNNVDLSALLSAVGLDGVAGTGRLSGTIPVRMAGKTVTIDHGRLAAAGPGVLRIRSDAAKTALASGGPEVVLMLSALEDFHYESLTLDIEKKAEGEGRVVLHTQGSNPAVRNGQPFVINLNVSGNVDRLAAVAAQALRLPGDLVRTIVPR